MNLAYKTALFCGLAPLVIGLFILIGYLVTRNQIFLDLGFINISLGFFSFVAGFFSLIVFEYKARRKEIRYIEILKRTLLPVVLLLVNFPSAVVCIYIAVKAEPSLIESSNNIVEIHSLNSFSKEQI